MYMRADLRPAVGSNGVLAASLLVLSPKADKSVKVGHSIVTMVKSQQFEMSCPCDSSTQPVLLRKLNANPATSR